MRNECSVLPLIGDTAPKFITKTTNGIIKFPDDFAGHWIILFSHPMDFTPVCTTEFLSFQSMMKDFQKLNTNLNRSFGWCDIFSPCVVPFYL